MAEEKQQEEENTNGNRKCGNIFVLITDVTDACLQVTRTTTFKIVVTFYHTHK